MIRAFLAIRIQVTEEFLKYYSSLQTALGNDQIKWVEEKNLHLTMQFFGNIPEKPLERYAGACREVVKEIPTFQSSFTHLGVFGSRYAPRVLWMGLENEEAFKALKENLLEALIKKGYRPERQNFVPHLTLGRIKQIQSKNYFQKVIDRHSKAPQMSFEINEVHLYESILHKDGPEYKIIERFNLKA